MCSFAYIIAIPRSYYSLNTVKATFKLLQAFRLMVLAISRSKSGAKSFIHTEHSSTLKDKQ
jgi:hypothetical protein